MGGRDFEDVKCVFAQFEASIEYSKCVVKFSHPADTKELDGSLAFVVKLGDLQQKQEWEMQKSEKEEMQMGE